MGLYDSQSAEVRDLSGLHLYHFFMSNCSWRVRLALEEKGLDWTSHHLNLALNEHVTASYQAINPNGVVPTLVHDGQVVLESNDILLYLEEKFPEPALVPSAARDQDGMGHWIERAGAIQGTIKSLSHELLFRRFRKVGPEDVAFLAEHHSNRELVEFMRDYSEEGAAWTSRVERAHLEMRNVLSELESFLADHAWLSGTTYGLADISWIVNAHRLVQAQYALDAYPKLLSWHERVTQRPAFDRAVLSYQPG
ncbi:MAG: glutathione S-transferase family protein [Myxococcota bacterium]|nr:glutathione S-transferase family protein [Myxococcota bacterium]